MQNQIGGQSPSQVRGRLDAVRAFSTSLACKSEPEVDHIAFSQCSRIFGLLRMQEQARGGLLIVFLVSPLLRSPHLRAAVSPR